MLAADRGGDYRPAAVGGRLGRFFKAMIVALAVAPAGPALAAPMSDVEAQAYVAKFFATFTGTSAKRCLTTQPSPEERQRAGELCDMVSDSIKRLRATDDPSFPANQRAVLGTIQFAVDLRAGALYGTAVPATHKRQPCDAYERAWELEAQLDRREPFAGRRSRSPAASPGHTADDSQLPRSVRHSARNAPGRLIRR